MTDYSTLGMVIARARKVAGLSQKQLAALILREDGEPGISPAYLNDIEHGRRSPSSKQLIAEFARILNIDADYLLVVASKQIPEDLAKLAAQVDEGDYRDALRLFRNALSKKADPR